MKTPEEIIQKRKELWEKYHDISKDRDYTDSIADYIVQDNDEGKAIRAAIHDNPELLIEMVFVIVDKKKQTVPFFLNEVQKGFILDLNKAKADYKQGKRSHLKFIVLKGRQQGFTSIITAYQLANSIVQRNFTGMTISDAIDNTNTIFEDKAKFPYSHLPEALKPTEKYNNRKEFQFEKLNSKWRIATAGNEDVGRSKTINFLHGSECAFWKSMGKILAGLGQALTQDSIQILETTANGYNEFKELWDESVKGESNWEPKFYEWWLTPEYRQEFETPEVEQEFKEKVNNKVDEFFKKLYNLRKHKGLDWQQLYWYDNKRRDLKNLLPQEYPNSSDEAFLHSGSCYFDVSKCDELILIYSDIKPARTLLNGGIVIYEEPEEGEMYVAGCDVAEGVEGGDYSHAKFFKLSTWDEVAYIHGHFSTDRFGELLVQYGKLYNNAYLGIERNNHGHAVLNTVYKYSKYKNIYFERSQDQKTDKKTKKLGWLTNESSKYLMLDELDSAIREDEIHPKDVNLFKEMREVVTDEKGKVDINGKDRVAATAIAWQMRKFARKSSFFIG